MANTEPKSGPKGNTNVILAYLLGPIYLLIEKKDKTLRFYAWQATFIIAALIILNIVISILHLWMFTSLVGLGATVLWIFLVVKAYQGEKIVLPIIGEWAQKYA